MNEGLTVSIEGIGVWAPGLANHAAILECLRGGTPAAGPAKPPATMLAAGERRRAPETVLLACEVAAQACAASGRAAESLPCVFTSMQGDVAITDYMCATLAANPLELSPTRFHNSVHNAAAGYWTIAAACHAASTAISAGCNSFAAGLLEAAVEAVAERTPVLLVAYDTGADGLLGEVIPNRIPFGIALVVNGVTVAKGDAPRLNIQYVATPASPLAVPAALSTLACANVIAAPALALLDVLAQGSSRPVLLASDTATHIRIEVKA